MKTETNLVVTKISIEEMLQRPEQDYNPKTWKDSIMRRAVLKDIQFYVIEKCSVWQYARFYTTYRTQDGLFLFNDFSAYSACITSNGFCKVFIADDGRVSKEMFEYPAGKFGYAENTPANRKLIIERVSSQNIMVSNCI
jgi:hypothetical protein